MISSGGFETATVNDISTKIGHLVVISLVVTAIGWLVAFVTALLPYAVALAIAVGFNISHWSYFVTGSLLTAAGFCPLYIAMPNLGINVQEPEPSLTSQYLHALPVLLICGAIAGLTCWHYLRRTESRAAVHSKPRRGTEPLGDTENV